MTVANREELLAHLRKNRMVLVSVRRSRRRSTSSCPSAGIGTRDIVIFTRQFATMINAGLPLVQSLDILAAQTENQKLGTVTTAGGVRRRGRQHARRRASASTPRRSAQLYVNMVAAGEAGGILDTILLRLATFLEKNDALIRKVKGAMIYPAVIFSVAVRRDRDPAHLRHPDLPGDVRDSAASRCRCRPRS